MRMSRAHGRARHCGQGTLEFVWLIIAVIGIIFALQPILKRAVGGRYRGSLDQLSQQHFDPTGTYRYEVHSGGTREDASRLDGSSESTVVGGDEVTRQALSVGSGDSIDVDSFVDAEPSTR